MGNPEKPAHIGSLTIAKLSRGSVLLACSYEGPNLQTTCAACFPVAFRDNGSLLSGTHHISKRLLQWFLTTRETAETPINAERFVFMVTCNE